MLHIHQCLLIIFVGFSPSVALNSAEEDPGDKKVGINDSEEESGEDNDNEERKG
jgi:hypothetical protein